MLLLLLLGFLIALIALAISRGRSGTGPLVPETRPALATVICLWEFASGVLVIYFHFHNLHRGAVITPPKAPIDGAVTILECILGIAAGIALWRMMRLAFYIFAVRFAVSIVYQFIFSAHHPAPMVWSEGMRIGLYTTQFLAYALSAAIVWYVYRITSLQPALTHPVPPLMPSS